MVRQNVMVLIVWKALVPTPRAARRGSVRKDVLIVDCVCVLLPVTELVVVRIAHADDVNAFLHARVEDVMNIRPML